MPPPTISHALFSVGARGLCHAIQCSRLLQVTSYLRWFNHQVIKTDAKLRWIHLQTTNRVSKKIQFSFSCTTPVDATAHPQSCIIFRWCQRPLSCHPMLQVAAGDQLSALVQPPPPALLVPTSSRLRAKQLLAGDLGI